MRVTDYKHARKDTLLRPASGWLEDEFNDVELFGQVRIAFVQASVFFQKVRQFFLTITAESKFREIHRLIRQKVNSSRHKLTVFRNPLDGNVVLNSIFKVHVQRLVGQSTKSNVCVAFD